MQKILMMIICLFVVVFLSSCNGREERLEYQLEQSTIENAKLHESLDGLVAAIKSDQNRREINEKAAGIAAGCDWLVSLCPITLVETGRIAIQNGYTPNLFYFWVNVLIKVIFVGVFIAVVVIATSLFFIGVINPRQVEQKQETFSFLTPEEALVFNLDCVKGEIMEYENTLDNVMQVVTEKSALILKLTETEQKLTKSVESLSKRHAFLEGEVGRLEALHVVLKVLD